MSSDSTAMEERRRSRPLCGAKMTPPRNLLYCRKYDE